MTEQKAIEGCKKQDKISQKYLFDTCSDGMLMVCMRYVDIRFMSGVTFVQELISTNDFKQIFPSNTVEIF
jgi:hypothetical protein